MSEDLHDLIGIFSGTGCSRGMMNGKSLGVVADCDGGFRAHCGQEKFLQGLRDYEKRKGRARSWKDSFKMQIRSSVAESLARKKKRESL